MGQSQLIEIAIGVVFVWFLLSVLLSVVNEGLALVFRIRAKHLWLAVGRIIRPAESKYARKLWDTVIRLPFKPAGLDQRPVANSESADGARATVQSHPLNQGAGTVEAELQELYNAAAPMLTDVGAVGRRSKITTLPGNVFSEAIASLAKRVHPADLVSAATALGWPMHRVSLVKSATAALPADLVLDLAAVKALSIPGASISEKEALFTNASTSLTPRDLVDYFSDNPRLQAAITHAVDAAGVEGKLTAGRDAIEKWYDREMDRLSATYRRQNRKVLLILSIPVVLFFRANTVGTVQDLNHDAALRQTLANGAISATANDTLEAAVKNMCTQATTTTTAPSATTTTTQAPAATPAPTTTTTSESTTTTIDPFKAAADRFSCAGTIVQSAERFGFTPGLGEVLHPSRWSFKDAWHWVVDDYGLIGRAITLIALMFGAQFWFDALRRLVGIRSKLTGSSGGAASG